MAMEKMRFGILGCGTIAATHARAIQSLPEAELAGVADKNPEAAKRMGEAFGVPVYENEEALFGDESIQGVCICTPSHLHEKNALDALSHHKHVVLEKPMALNAEAADRVLQGCLENHCLLTVISQLRFAPEIRRVKALLKKGAFGKLLFCNLSMRYWRSPEYFSSSSWRGRLQYEGGGALMNQGIHGMDVLQYLLGTPKVLKGKIHTLHHDVEVEDTASALLEFDQGVLCTVQASTCAWPGFDRRLEIHGDKGFAVLKEDRIEQLETPEEKIDRRAQGMEEKDASRQPAIHDYTLHALQIANLIAAVRGKALLAVDAGEGRKAIRMIEAIYQSSREG